MDALASFNSALTGRYEIEREIGAGGMATVYLARDARHDRKVALKVLRADLGAVLGVERFLSEIRVTANLQHPNLLPLFDSGEADGQLFYVMPFVEGESLRARLTREKQLPIDEAVRIAGAVASALDYAHRQHVIHRDLKPENVLLQDGQPLVADFGIALAVSNAGGARITQTGLSLGTPQYMSPEQATGDRVIDGRTDIYSLGAVTYEMLTGEPPHVGSSSQAVIARVLTETPRAIRLVRPSVPEHVEIAVDHALEKLPADRFGTVKEFSEALTGARVVTLSSSTRAQRSPRRRVNGQLLTAWTVAAAATIAVGVLATRPDPPPPPAPLTQFEVNLLDSMQLAFAAVTLVHVSHDGSTIVFGGRERGRPRALYMRRLEDLTPQRIPGTDSALSPVLSPDGSEVLFAMPRSDGGNDLKRVSLRGGAVHTVVRDVPNSAQWSWIDDQRILFSRGSGLLLVPSAGGEASHLVALDTSRRHLRYGSPDVLPGGQAALITLWRAATSPDSTYIGVVSLVDGRVTDLGIRAAFARYSGTGHIVFATARDAMLLAVPFDASSLRVTGPAFPVVEGVRVEGGAGAAMSVARNGTLVYVPKDAAEIGRSLLIVDRSGKTRPVLQQPGSYSSPRVSPDGRQIALAVGTAGPTTNLDIWRVDTTSRTLIRVTTDSTNERPRWRDNERLAYIHWDVSVGTAMERQLYVASAPTTLLRHAASIADFAVGTAHGYGALRVGARERMDIWLVHMDSLDSPRPFLTGPYVEHSPAISPDGKLIAYVTMKTGRPEVYVQRIEGGGGEVQVSVGGGLEPVWSREGGELFYHDSTHLVSAAIAGVSPIAVTRRDTLFRTRGVFFRAPNFSSFDVFPGGHEFVMVGPRTEPRRDAPPAPLVVKMNWHQRAAARREP